MPCNFYLENEVNEDRNNNKFLESLSLELNSLLSTHVEGDADESDADRDNHIDLVQQIDVEYNTNNKIVPKINTW